MLNVVLAVVEHLRSLILGLRFDLHRRQLESFTLGRGSRYFPAYYDGIIHALLGTWPLEGIGKGRRRVEEAVDETGNRIHFLTIATLGFHILFIYFDN